LAYNLGRSGFVELDSNFIQFENQGHAVLRKPVVRDSFPENTV